MRLVDGSIEPQQRRVNETSKGSKSKAKKETIVRKQRSVGIFQESKKTDVDRREQIVAMKRRD